MTQPGPWSPLGRPLFRALWIAGLASNVGTWMQNVGAAWLMTSLAPEPFIVALVQAASNLPFFLLAIPSGALADVVDRRQLAMAALGWLACAAALLAALTFAGRVGPVSLLALTFMIGLGSALFSPAFASIVPELVPRAEIEPAVSLSGISMNLARAAGPALGGLVVAAAGPGATFALNAFSFLAVMGVLLTWRREVPERRLPPEDLVGAMRAGVRYVRHSPSLQAVLWRTAAFVLPASAIWALLPLYAREQLSLGPAGYGVLLGFFGVGAVIGGLLLPGVRQRLGAERMATWSTVLFAASQLTLGRSHALVAAGASLLVAGGTWLALLSMLNAAAQVSISSWVRARALSIHMLVLFGGLAAGSAAWGALAGRIGVPRSFELAAAVIVLGRIAVWSRRLPQRGASDLEIVSQWPDPQVTHSFEPDRGPALVTVEYEIEPERRAEFAGAMRELREIRLRDGAIRWGLWADTAQSGRYLESFVVESWLEHLRQHERVTASDVELLAIAHAFHRGPTPPRVTHFIHEQIPESRSGRPDR
jgi:MFS family permease